MRKKSQVVDWTDEQTALVAEQYQSGLSAGEIADDWATRFGIKITRNMIAGKLNRLGLRRDPYTEHTVRSRRTSQSAAIRTPRPLPPVKSPPLVPDQAPPPPPPPKPRPPKGGMGLFDLTDQSCRWPIGNHPRRGYRFCGKPLADLTTGKPYCDEHHDLAHA